MIIREINKNDRVGYLKMSAEFYSSPAVLHDIPASFRVNAFERYLTDGLSKCFIFEEDGMYAGYGIVCLYFSQEAGGMCALFDEVYVREGFRSRGFGRAFFEHVFKTVPAARYVLEVEPENVRARALYKRLGFCDLGYLRMFKAGEK